MKKLVIGGMLLTKLLTQNPDFAHSKVVEISDVSKSNIVTVLDDTVDTPTLDQIHTKESILANLMMNKKFHRELVGELRDWKEWFLSIVNYLSDKERLKEFFYAEILQEFEKKDFPIKILDSYFLKKYWKDLYKTIGNFFLNTTLLIALENEDYNVFVDSEDKEFYELTPELLTIFQEYGLNISGNPSNFYFKKQEDGSISMISSDFDKERTIATISKKNINETYDKVFNIVHELIQMIEGV